jgi:hypothetical protein
MEHDKVIQQAQLLVMRNQHLDWLVDKVVRGLAKLFEKGLQPGIAYQPDVIPSATGFGAQGDDQLMAQNMDLSTSMSVIFKPILPEKLHEVHDLVETISARRVSISGLQADNTFNVIFMFQHGETMEEKGNHVYQLLDAADDNNPTIVECGRDLLQYFLEGNLPGDN